MKKIKKQIVLLLLCLVSQFGMWAQYNEIGEYTESGEDYLSDLYKSEYLYKRETEKCDCEEGDNFSFDISGGATLEEIRLQNYERLIAYNIKKYKNWLKAQYKILEVEIEKQLGQQFSSFASAQTHYYKKLEAFHVSQNVGPVVETYATKVTHRIKAKTTCLSNIKLLEFWEEKINTGNANNSQYGHLKVGSTPLSALTTSEQLNALKKQEIASFGENEWRLVSEKNVKEKLMEIQSVNYKTTSHPIHEELSKLQKDYFYDYRDLDRLNLMQMYLTKQFIRGPLWPRMLSAYEDESVRSDPQHSGRQYRYVYPMTSGSRSFIEDYAIRNNGGAISIFHPGFSSYYLFIGFSVIKESQINMALKEISEEAMLLEICFENINIKNRNFIENNTALKEAVAAYFIENDYSKPAINFVGTMMKQYRTNLDFWPDPKYYVSYDGITSIPCPWDFSDRKESNIICDARARYPVFQNANRKDLALEIMFKLEALRDGFLNFGDVIAALYSGSSYGGKKGYIIRNAFNANGFSIPSGLSNKTLETYFYFKKNAYGDLLGIYFKPGLGEFLFDNGISLQEFLDEYWENIEETANNDCEIGKAKDSNGNCVACVDKDVFGNCTKITWVRDADNDNYYAAGSERKEYASWTAATGFKKKSDAVGVDCDDTKPDVHKLNSCGECKKESECDGPCKNKDLRHFEVPSNLQQEVDGKTQTNPYPPHGQVNSFWQQKLEDGYGDINLDRYELDINKLPDGYTPQQLFEEIRTNFSDFVTGGDYIGTGVDLEPYSQEDGLTWASNNPVGAAMDFDNAMDTSTVICTDYSLDNMNWTFTTYGSFDHAGHFVAGHRQFGIEDNGNGSYSFYLRGADRLGQWMDFVANGFNTGADVLFNNAADATWKNLMESLEKFIKEKPGADVSHFDKNKDDYAKRYDYNKNDCPE